MKKLTNDIFITRAKNVHGNKYGYDKVIYNDYQTHVDIYCNVCDLYFKQTPSIHITNKCGCPFCANNIKYTNEKFIEKSIEIFGNKYGYDAVVYTGNKHDVKLYCKICNKYFTQSPNNHLAGHGCPSCSGNKRSNNEKFEKDSNIIHNNKYDYSLVEYVNNRTKVKIICPIHGIFTQTPDKHKNRTHGCSKCNSSKGEISIIKLLTTNNIIFTNQKRFSDCRNILPLPFDFYLPDHNICIEYDGKQHFEPFLKFGGEEKFEKTKTHDKIKTKYCSEKNIDLIRIKYNENILEKLSFLTKNPE